MPLFNSFFGGLVIVFFVGRGTNFFLGRVAQVLNEKVDGSYLIIAIVILYYSITTPVLVWWWTGTWRAATKKNAANFNLWALLAKICVVVFVAAEISLYMRDFYPKISDAANEIAGDPQWADGHITVSADRRILYVDGHITRSLADKFISVLRSSHKVRVIELNSVGGRIVPALTMQAAIRKRNLTTLVTKQCSSACVAAYIGGADRLISEDAKIGFHAVTIGNAIAEENNEALKNEMLSMGISRSFLEKALAHREIWYPNANELKAAAVVTKILHRSKNDA